MSYKQITIAVCDLCGHTEPAAPAVSGHDRLCYYLPTGWGLAANNPSVHICPTCMAKLLDKPQTTPERRSRHD